MRNPIIINGQFFKNQDLAKSYVRELLGEIGVCDSVGALSITHKNILHELVCRHPNHLDKLKNFQDFSICRNPLNKKGWELNIINDDDSITRVSWNVCVTQRNKPGPCRFVDEED